MHTVELLHDAVATAERLGYIIREEWLGGVNGGPCEFKGRKWLFLDSSLNPMEQLDQVCATLRLDPSVHLIDLPAHLQKLLDIRRPA